MGKKRKAEEINASSMADIAFLLLIFFLVTTQLTADKGILQRLPPLVEDEPPPEKKSNKRNTLIVLVNKADQLLVNGKRMELRDLRDHTKTFIDNRRVRPDMSVSPQVAIVSLQNDVGTTYKMYIGVLNELKAAYRELRDEYSDRLYGKTFQEIKDERIPPKIVEGKLVAPGNVYDDYYRKIIGEYPYRLSEAEPEKIGDN